MIERLFFGQGLTDRPALLLSSLLVVLGLQLFALGLLGELIIFTHARAIKDYQVERRTCSTRPASDAGLTPCCGGTAAGTGREGSRELPALSDSRPPHVSRMTINAPTEIAAIAATIRILVRFRSSTAVPNCGIMTSGETFSSEATSWEPRTRRVDRLGNRCGAERRCESEHETEKHEHDAIRLDRECRGTRGSTR